MKRQLILTFKEKLNCGACDSVLIKVKNPALLAVNDGLGPDQQTPFLRGKIIGFQPVTAPECEGLNYEYHFEYDDVDLLDPSTPLGECDIERVCCADCVIDYIDTIIVQPQISQLIDNGDGTFTHINEVGTVVTFNALSTLVDNLDNTYTYTDEIGAVTTVQTAHTLTNPVDSTIRLTRPDGTFDDLDLCPVVSSCSLAVLTSLPITGDGTPGDPITLLFSTDVGNIATLGSDQGLYVPPAAPGGVVTDDTIDGDGSLATPLSAPISADAGNILSTGSDGKHYLNCNDTLACINVDVMIEGTGTVFNPFSVPPSSDPNNALILGSDDHLYVLINSGTMIDGFGTAVDPLEVNPSADAGNLIIFGTDNKLHAPLFHNATLLGLGTSGSPLSVPLSTTAGNVLILGGDGRLLARVFSDNTIDGLGTAASPLSVPVSSQAGNLLTLGADSKHFLNCAAIQTCLPAEHTTFIPGIGYTDGNVDGLNVGVPYTSPIGGPLNLVASAVRNTAFYGHIIHLPRYTFRPGTTHVTVAFQQRVNGGAWTTIATDAYRYVLGGSNEIEHGFYNSTPFRFTVPAGGVTTLETRFILTPVANTGGSTYNGSAGSLQAIGSTV